MEHRAELKGLKNLWGGGGGAAIPTELGGGGGIRGFVAAVGPTAARPL